MKNNLKMRFGAMSVFGLSALILAGCGGGGSGGDTPQNIPDANLVALSSNDSLLFFDSRTPYTVATRPLTGLVAGESLIGIDYRFAPLAGATTGAGLFGLARTGTTGTSRLVRIDLSNNGAAITTVGTPFTLPFTASNIGFDIDPVADRVRVVDSTSATNLQINPDTGALVDGDATTTGTQSDTPVAYDSGDVGKGTTPHVAGSAYTNNFVGATTTVNYAIDTARGALVTQGRPANPAIPGDVAVSPDSGRLFTVGTLTNPVSNNGSVGFDIAPSTNDAFAVYSSNGTQRLFAINLSTAQTTGGAKISLSSSGSLLGLAVLP